MSHSVERRALAAIELRVEQQGKEPAKISGYAALFNEPSYPMRTAKGSQFREIIKPGAFGDATEADVMARYNHQLLLGRTSAGTLKLSVDERGLKYEITPSTSALTDHVVQAIQRGDVKGSSFAFRTLGDKWKVVDGETVRELTSVGLVDVGPVDSPAYGSTAADGNAVSVRSLGGDEDAIDAEVAKLQPAEKRYYYNSDASDLTNQLRSALDGARQMFDNMTKVVDLLAKQSKTLTAEETAAANDLADELSRCTSRCGSAIESLKSVGVTATTAADAPETNSLKTPLLDARQRRFELV